MHLRLSTAIGLPVVDDAEDRLGTVSGMFMHPDTGVIEGIFVSMNGFFASETLFLPSAGIEHWGSRIRVRNMQSLSPLGDIVRLAQLEEEGRRIIGQPMVTEEGRRLGWCRDVQFDTRMLRLEWLFPRRLLRWGVPVPITAIVQVRPDAIVVRDKEEVKEVVKEAVPALNPIETLTPT